MHSDIEVKACMEMNITFHNVIHQTERSKHRFSELYTDIQSGENILCMNNEHKRSSSLTLRYVCDINIDLSIQITCVWRTFMKKEDEVLRQEIYHPIFTPISGESKEVVLSILKPLAALGMKSQCRLIIQIWVVSPKECMRKMIHSFQLQPKLLKTILNQNVNYHPSKPLSIQVSCNSAADERYKCGWTAWDSSNEKVQESEPVVRGAKRGRKTKSNVKNKKSQVEEVTVLEVGPSQDPEIDNLLTQLNLDNHETIDSYPSIEPDLYKEILGIPEIGLDVDLQSKFAVQERAHNLNYSEMLGEDFLDVGSFFKADTQEGDVGSCSSESYWEGVDTGIDKKDSLLDDAFFKSCWESFSYSGEDTKQTTVQDEKALLRDSGGLW